MQRVFVVDHEKRPLMPCRPARARWLLSKQRAAIFRHVPFTLILHEVRPEAVVAPQRLKIDPGSVTAGLAIVSDATGDVVWAGELTHRGKQVKARRQQRRACRRARRQRHTRYRKAR
jgi:RRXRR protein